MTNTYIVYNSQISIMCVFVISGRKGNVDIVFKGFTIFIDVLKGIENTKEI
jgi:hypothetical protein